MKRIMKRYVQRRRIDDDTRIKMVSFLKDSTNMRGSVIPVGMDRYGNTYFLFPYDFNYLYMKTSDPILRRMKEVASKSPLLQSMNLVPSQREYDSFMYIKRYESGTLSGSVLCGW